MKDAQFINPELLSLIVDGKSYDIDFEPQQDDRLAVRVCGRVIKLEMLSERQAKLKAARSVKLGKAGSAQIKAPMPGKIIRILVSPGDEVEEGQGLLIMEAMKMENELRAPRKGVVRELRVQIGQSVESGALLLLLE